MQTAPDRVSIRATLVQLAHRHDLPPDTIVERARVFETYVFGEQPADKP